ncbi:hypothetical protein, conserved [Eimeria brunetti]|uniref:VTC domain-containing protein n=1 Tax=Eimeria brunetti TaxID=51314 RepID=U6LG13_9EIME|nr:hypothetical protein, conserved [Eimeria brunetti]
MAAASFHMQVPAHYLPAYVDIRQLKKQLEEVVHNAQRQRATVRRRLDILQRPRILPSGMAQKPTSPAAASDNQEVEPNSPHAAADATQSQLILSTAAAAARADDGMAGSSLRAEAETLSLLPEAQFWGLLQQQVHELNKFATAKERQIQKDLRLIAARMKQARLEDESLSHRSALICLNTPMENAFEVPRSFCALGHLLERLLGTAEIIHLDLYIRTNHKALLFLCSHFDRLLTGEAYCNVDLERLVLMLSLLWGKFRSKLEGRQLGSEAWKPPDSFVRATTKYWIRPENIVRAQCLIVRHLPFLVFGTSDKDLEESLLGSVSASGRHNLRAPNLAPTQMVASVYFDSANAYSYERRIRRFEGAQLLRFRWYGTNNNGPDEDIFIERKTHHESWSGMSSTKERFVVPQRLVAPYMLLQRSARDLLLEASGFQLPTANSGTAPVPSTSHGHSGRHFPVGGDSEKNAADAYIARNGKLRKAIQLGEEIQRAIAENHLQPMLRTSYLRAAFQLATSNAVSKFIAVRISLDTNLCMVNEYRPQKQEDGGFNWCRLADELLGRDEVVRFPYAILEVKVQQQPPPAWVQSMLLLSDASEGEAVVAAEPDWEDVTATEAHRTFCWLRAQQKRQLQQAPRALCHEGSGDGEFEEGIPRANSASSVDSVRQRLARRHIRTVKKIDPKTSFAAERTFLHYIQKGLYLAGASLACVETVRGDWGLGVVLILAIASVFLCCGAYAIYVKRCRRISQRVAKAGAANVHQRIDSQWGPLLAFFAAGVATLLVLVLQVDVNLRSVLKHEQAEHSALYRHKGHAEPVSARHTANEL